MARILVTGGAGFIGSNFVKMMINEHPDVEIVNLDALTYAGNLENLKDVEDHPSYKFVHGDIRDHERMQAIVTDEKITGIINFAAESHVDRSIEEPNIFVETNVTGTLNLLKAARDNEVARFLQVSTDEVYGSLEPDDPAFTEENYLCPNSPYAASKTAADHMVRAFRHTFGLDTVVTRCSNNYGPMQFPEKMIPLMFNNARNDKDLPVYGDGLQVRDWLYVYDHCTAIWAAYKKGKAGGIYNIGGNNEKTNLDVVGQILKFLNKPESLIKHVEDRKGHDRRYAIDSSKAMKELDWAPSVTFEEALPQTLQWYLDNQHWVENVTSGAYQEYYENMYKNR